MSTLTQLFTSIANSIRAKKGTSALIEAEDFPTEIETIQTGITPTGTIDITQNGITDVTTYANANVNVAASSEEKDVFFYDYDGTLLYSYTKSAFLALSAMPANPTHTGLVADGWNWTLSDAQAYVEELGKLNIGQLYHTSSGLMEIDIKVNSKTGLSVTLNMDGTKNWGDGTSDDTTSHTYTTAGTYTITCDGTNMANSYVFGQNSSAFNYYVTSIKLTGLTFIASAAFGYCKSLESVIFPAITTLNTYQTSTFSSCEMLKILVFPSGITSIPNFFCQGCYALKTLCFPDSVHSIGNSTFQNCRMLSLVTLSSQFSSFTNNAFSGCNALEYFIFKCGSTGLMSNLFQNCYNLKEINLPTTMTTSASIANVFDGCRSLEEIEFPASATRVPNYCFANCYSLKRVTLSKNITTMGTGVFQYCYLLKEVDFSEFTAVPSIQSGTFNDTNKLIKIIVPDSLYSTWIAAAQWSSWADNIVKASQA